MDSVTQQQLASKAKNRALREIKSKHQEEYKAAYQRHLAELVSDYKEEMYLA